MKLINLKIQKLSLKYGMSYHEYTIIKYKSSIHFPANIKMSEIDYDAQIAGRLNDGTYDTHRVHQNINSGQIIEQQKLDKAQADQFVLKRAGHPICCIATIIFKAAAILSYFLLAWFLGNVVVFIMVLIMSSFDFWVVKNVSGRLLVGLRWSTDIDSKGNQIWKFESHGPHYQANKIDSTFFWGSQLLSFLFWGIMLVINVLTLSIFWAILVFVSAALSFLNLYGYYKCKGDHQKKLKELKGKGIVAMAGRFF